MSQRSGRPPPLPNSTSFSTSTRPGRGLRTLDPPDAVAASAYPTRSARRDARPPLWHLVRVIAFWILVIGVTLYALHRLGLWLERRGWLFYRDRRATTSALGGMLELHALLEPGRRYVIEEQRKEQLEEADAGDPLEPWTPRER